jgi:hypothetical protein
MSSLGMCEAILQLHHTTQGILLNYVKEQLYFRLYKGKSISFRTEFFALLRSVVTIPAASGVIPKVSWASVLKASFLYASCVTQL